MPYNGIVLIRRALFAVHLLLLHWAFAQTLSLEAIAVSYLLRHAAKGL